MITDFETDAVVFFPSSYDEPLPTDDTIIKMAHGLWAQQNEVSADSFYCVGPVSRTRFLADPGTVVIDKVVKIVSEQQTDKLLKGFISGA